MLVDTCWTPADGDHVSSRPNRPVLTCLCVFAVSCASRVVLGIGWYASQVWAGGEGAEWSPPTAHIPFPRWALFQLLGVATRGREAWFRGWCLAPRDFVSVPYVLATSQRCWLENSGGFYVWNSLVQVSACVHELRPSSSRVWSERLRPRSVESGASEQPGHSVESTDWPTVSMTVKCQLKAVSSQRSCDLESGPETCPSDRFGETCVSGFQVRRTRCDVRIIVGTLLAFRCDPE